MHSLRVGKKLGQDFFENQETRCTETAGIGRHRRHHSKRTRAAYVLILLFVRAGTLLLWSAVLSSVYPRPEHGYPRSIDR